MTLEFRMKIAIVLAICVIFASGTYAAFAEEPIPELIFEGGDFIIHSGNHIHLPIIIQVENHDHKIFPELKIIFENQIIDVIALKQSSSGFFQSFLNINENYATGSYYLQLVYDEINSEAIPFNIIREHEKQKERSLGFGDYSSGLYAPKESYINVSQSHIDIEFSTSTRQHIEGVYDLRGMTGSIKLEVSGPKSFTNIVKVRDTGIFETFLITDREWPTGTYKITGKFNEKIFSTTEFTIKNFNKDSLIMDVPITGELDLETVKSNQFNVILIKGTLSTVSIPEQIGLIISEGEETIETLYVDVGNSGSFETSLVLYDNMERSPWQSGIYTVNIVNAGTLEPYSISSNFEVVKSGDVLTELEHGILLAEEENTFQVLEFVNQIEIEKYHPKEIKIFGIIESYISGTLVNISVVNQKGQIDEFSIYAKKDGQYEVPIVIDKEWEPGNYDIYVNYKDEIQNSVSFKIEAEHTKLLEINEEKNDSLETEYSVEEFKIIQKDSSTNQFVKLEFSTTKNNPGLNHIHAMLEKPDGSEFVYKVRILNDGDFEVPLIIENSWEEGKYSLYIEEDGKKTTFGKFSIVKEVKETQLPILSKLLESANPEVIYEKNDTMYISDNSIVMLHNGIQLDVRGSIQDYSPSKTILNVYEKGNLYSSHKILPQAEGEFSSPILITGELSEGFHEINVTHDERIVGNTEFLVISPLNIYTKFYDEPIKISQDMFVESGNKIGVNIIGFIDDFDNTNYNLIEITILHPDNKIETDLIKPAKWGYYSYEKIITDKWKNGTYVISAKFNGDKLGHIYVQLTDFEISWLKMHAEKWLEGEISKNQYENRINHIIDEELLDMKHIKQNSIPDWMKISTEKWINEELTQEEYFEIIKFFGN